MVLGRDWERWHRQYDDEGSSLSRRLLVVQRRLREALDLAPAGAIRLVSVCAGEGRDVIGLLADHDRRSDVMARLVELDGGLAATARGSAAAAGLEQVEVVQGDAGRTEAYEGAVPADVVLVCGVFGNISNTDIRATIAELPHLCAAGATVIWTRHRREPDITPAVRAWFEEAGFDEVALETAPPYLFAVGTERLRLQPRAFRPGRRMFTFVGDGTDAVL